MGLGLRRDENSRKGGRQHDITYRTMGDWLEWKGRSWDRLCFSEALWYTEEETFTSEYNYASGN